ncbi:transposase [Thermomonospora amylolytica]|uniref:transposase n=1 Tax=Thermomonospora amylolytica TaxID=1411117 RepID=UPI0018E56F94|nr:transposase [Thermomonospora amylolytica]
MDDFALRRGRIHGTILIDLATSRPVDVLADRTADTPAAWLRDHPGVEIVCRDRAGAYADGIARGAPEAIQVADRWHLWHNLGEAVERTVTKHRRHLQDLIDAPVAQPDGLPAPPTANPSVTPETRQDRIAERTRQRHAAIHALIVQGHGLRQIAHELNLGRNTVRRQELCVLGYRGGDTTVRQYVKPWRTELPAAPASARPPTVRQATGWFLRNPAHLDPDDHRRLDALCTACPQLAALRAHVRRFTEMMVHRAGQRLEAWMSAVLDDDLPELHSFVTGLTLPYSSGPVEGHVNRTKTIKRQMYGRANPDLLRKRILLAD